jgi:hypothetical protein
VPPKAKSKSVIAKKAPTMAAKASRARWRRAMLSSRSSYNSFPTSDSGDWFKRMILDAHYKEAKYDDLDKLRKEQNRDPVERKQARWLPENWKDIRF